MTSKTRFDWQSLSISLVFLAMMAFKIFNQSLTDWDARSIWFFHGKIVFYTDQLLNEAIWADPSLHWAHFDYPKINALLSALLAKMLGQWNESDARLSLLLLELPLLLLAAGFSRSITRKILLVALVTLKPGTLMWDGRMDGILAAYIALGCVYGGRFLRDKDHGDLLVAILAAGVGATLKNEGMVLAALLYAAIFLGGLIFTRSDLLKNWRRLILPLGLVTVSTGYWLMWKHFHGVVNDLADGSPYARLMSRISDVQALDAIIGSINRPKEVRAVLPFILAALVALKLPSIERGKTFKAYLPSLFVATLYTLIVVTVYLSTPLDLRWHLDTSANRVVQPIYLCMVMSLAAFLREKPTVLK